MIDLEALVAAAVAAEVKRQLAALGVANSNAPAPALVTVAEYARARSISISTVRAAIREGRLAVERIGKRSVRVPANATIARPTKPTDRATIDREMESALGLSLADAARERFRRVAHARRSPAAEERQGSAPSLVQSACDLGLALLRVSAPNRRRRRASSRAS